MNVFKWISIVVGMICLFVGLNIQSYGIIKSLNGYLDIALIYYIVGATILVFPPIIDLKFVRNIEERDFSRLLIVFELFLVGSGFLFYWKGDLLTKIVLRITASFLVTAFIKYVLLVLPEFKWRYFINPFLFLRYHVDCIKGKYGPAYILCLGIDWLGIGYAFLEYPFGSAALLIGSICLFISSWRGYKATKANVPLAWSILNAVYSIYGLFFFICSVLRESK